MSSRFNINKQSCEIEPLPQLKGEWRDVDMEMKWNTEKCRHVTDINWIIKLENKNKLGWWRRFVEGKIDYGNDVR
jgi:hypothetical protein